MKRIDFNQESFDIVTEKKAFLSNKIKTKVERVELKDISKVSRDEFENVFNSMSIFMNDNNEHFITNEKCYNLEELYDFLFKNSDNYNYKIAKFDIDTCKETLIK